MKKSFLLILAALFIGVGFLNAQTRAVSGKVTTTAGDAVIGASVVVEGTTIGVVTNVDGDYYLPNVPADAKRLQFSYVGMETVTADIQPIVNVQLSDSQLIEQVVVTGMGRSDRRMFTGATDQLVGDQVRIDGVSDISRGLEGRSAGVSVQNLSGTFGAAPKIQVRGATSILGTSKPLWVVDGVILEDAVELSANDLASGNAETLISSAVAGLNSDDIESFQILKDGSATSIYGAKAMAGVIVITTKRGKAGMSTFNYTGEFTMRLVPTYNEFNIMNSQDQMSVYNEMYDKGFLRYAKTYRLNNSGVYGNMYKLLNQYNSNYGNWNLNINDPSSVNAYLRAAEMRNTDWFKELFSPNISQSHSVSMSGGTDRGRYYSSMSLMSDPGWSKRSKVSRYTMNMNGSFDIYDNLTLTVIGSASYRKQEAPGTLAQDRDVVSGAISRSFDINPYSYALNTSRVSDPKEFYTMYYAPFNIHHELKNNYIDLEVADLKFHTELRWKVIPGLELAALAAAKYSIRTMDQYIKDKSNMAEAYRAMDDAVIAELNPFLYTDPDVLDASPQSVLASGGILDKKVIKMFSWDARFTAQFNRTFGNSTVDAFGGMEVNYADRNNSFNRGWGYQYDKGGTPFINYLYFKQMQEQKVDYYSNDDTRARDAAFFLNATYSWKGKYAVNGTIRYEGSNALGKSRKSRWLPTWNISGSWNVHEEDFFRNIENVLTHLKLRASYSLTGERPPFGYAFAEPIYGNEIKWAPSVDLQESVVRLLRLENSELTYEKKNELNVGLEFGFLDNRISVITDGFLRWNKDLMGLVYTQGTGGETMKYANMAKMNGRGIELTVNSRNIEKGNFKWGTDFVFSWITNEITDLDTRMNLMDAMVGREFMMEGYPHASMFSIPFVRLNNSGIPMFINTDGILTTDNIDFQAVITKDGLDESGAYARGNVRHLVYEGPLAPTITGSLGNTFSYKNWRLYVYMTYSFGNKIRLDGDFSSTYSDLSAMPREFKNRWMMPGDEYYTNVPAIASARQANGYNLQKSYNAYNNSHLRAADGGFIRMKEVSLSYDFNENVLNKLKMKSLQLKFQATNLFLLYADKKLQGQDPEFLMAGGVAMPMPKQFTLTLRIGF